MLKVFHLLLSADPEVQHRRVPTTLLCGQSQDPWSAVSRGARAHPVQRQRHLDPLEKEKRQLDLDHLKIIDPY